jgi:hypothetical protein
MTQTATVGQTYTRLLITFTDANDQTLTDSVTFQPYNGETNLVYAAAIGVFLSDLEVVSNCRVDAKQETITEVTYISDKTPGTANFAAVDNALVLAFARANPLRPLLRLGANFPVPGYIVGVASEDAPNMGTPKTTTTEMARIVDFLNKRLAQRYTGDGQFYNGFAYDATKSNGVSFPDIVNNQ